MKRLRILKAKCADCGHLNLISMSVAADRGEPIRCEKCGRVLILRE